MCKDMIKEKEDEDREGDLISFSCFNLLFRARLLCFASNGSINKFDFRDKLAIIAFNRNELFINQVIVLVKRTY